MENYCTMDLLLYENDSVLKPKMLRLITCLSTDSKLLESNYFLK